jgi:hypothetical protein
MCQNSFIFSSSEPRPSPRSAGALDFHVSEAVSTLAFDAIGEKRLPILVVDLWYLIFG